jgi:ATP-dependent protease ClpP protease subunit
MPTPKAIRNSLDLGGTEAPRMSARVELENGSMRGKLHLYDAIGGWDGIYAKDVVAKLDELKDQGAQALDVHVHSPGGDVFEGVAIHSALKTWSAGERHVHVDGLAASIASMVAMAGDKITIAPHAMFMIHGPRAYAIGTAEQMQQAAARLKAMKSEMIDCYAGRTGLAKVEVERMMDAETWLNAKDSIAKGFADAIAGREDDEDEDGDEKDDGDEHEEARFRAVASALFAHPPPELAKLLTPLPLPCAKVPAAPQQPPPSPSPQEQPPKEQTMTPAEEKAMAALERTASDAASRLTAVTAQLDASSKVAVDIMALTGKATVGEAVAHVAGLKEKAARTDELAAELEKVRAAQRQSEITALLDEASKAGRLTPAKRAEFLKADAPQFAKDPTQLKAFLECLGPPVVAKTGEGARPTEEKPDQLPELTEVEKAQALKARVSFEGFQIMKHGGSAAYDEYLKKKAAVGTA